MPSERIWKWLRRVVTHHYWCARLNEPIAAQLVKPAVQLPNNDTADAAASEEAVTRPTMRFVPSRASTSRTSRPCIAPGHAWCKRATYANAVRGLLGE
jgi:transposase